MNVDTELMRTIANEINTYATTYQSMISAFYSKIANLANSSAWWGLSSKRYAELALLDNTNMLAVGDRIKSFSKYIKNAADDLDNTVNKAESEN